MNPFPRCRSSGIDIVFEFGVEVGSTSAPSTHTNPGQTEAIKALRTYDVRILVLLVNDINTAGAFLLKAIGTGALSSNTIMLGPADVTTSALWLTAANTPGGPSAATIKSVLGGYIGIAPPYNDWKVCYFCPIQILPPTSY